MITLEFEVEGKSLRLTSQQILTSGSTNVDEVKFVFDSSWDDFSVKTAILNISGYFEPPVRSSRATVPVGAEP